MKETQFAIDWIGLLKTENEQKIIAPDHDELCQSNKGINRAYEIVLEALREKHARDEPKPLTVGELRGINANMGSRRWVWINFHTEERNSSAYYQSQFDYTQGEAFSCGYPGYTVHFNYEDYGKTWIAYDHQPKEARK